MFEGLRSQFIRFIEKWKGKVKNRKNDTKSVIEQYVVFSVFIAWLRYDLDV
jgi:hypothetical protein